MSSKDMMDGNPHRSGNSTRSSILSLSRRLANENRLRWITRICGSRQSDISFVARQCSLHRGQNLYIHHHTTHITTHPITSASVSSRPRCSHWNRDIRSVFIQQAFNSVVTPPKENQWGITEQEFYTVDAHPVIWWTLEGGNAAWFTPALWCQNPTSIHCMQQSKCPATDSTSLDSL